jgi:hypothetical protein
MLGCCIATRTLAGRLTPMDNDQQDQTKDQLEKAKLALEIQDLRKPIYLKPAFYAVLGPTSLALVTLGIGFYTGLFNVQNERIRNETALLEIQKAKLNSDITTLRNDVATERQNLATERERINAELKNERDRLQVETQRIRSEAQQEITKEREKSDLEMQKLATAFDTEKRKLIAELEPLQEQIKSVEEQIKVKNRELGELRVESENRRIVTLLDQMKGDRNLNPFNVDSQGLIAFLRNEQDKASIVEARLQNETDPLFKANIMYVLYNATQQRIWLDRLFEFVRIEQNARASSIWKIFGAGRWVGDDELEVMKFILRQAAVLKLSHNQIGEALQRFQLPNNSPKEAITTFSTDEAIGFIRLGRELALDINVNVQKVYGILAAAFFVPEAYPVLASVVLLSKQESEEHKARIREHIREVRAGMFEKQYLHLNQTLIRLEFAKDVLNEANLSQWQKNKSCGWI